MYIQTALETLHRRHIRAPYQLLTQAIEEADIAVKASTMIFINNFITSTQSLDDRVMIRNYLLSQDLTQTCEQIIKDFDPEREVELYQELLNAPPTPTSSLQHTSRAFFGGSSVNLHTSMSLSAAVAGHNELRPTSTLPQSPPIMAFDRGMSIR